MPLAIEPLDVPAPSEPMVLEVIHSVQCGITPKRLLLPNSDDEILSRTDEDVSSIRDGFSARAISDPSTTLERHLVRRFSPQLKYCFDNNVPNCVLEQTRTSILSCNPGPRRGMEGTIEGHYAGKWHIIALQEASDRVLSPRLPHEPL